MGEWAGTIKFIITSKREECRNLEKEDSSTAGNYWKYFEPDAKAKDRAIAVLLEYRVKEIDGG